VGWQLTTSMLDHKVWASRIVASLKRFSPSGKYRLTVVVSNIMLALIESDAPLESMQLDMGILGKDNLRFEER
ncbi:MAG: hypothetical protein CL694_00635, partial [Chloroflexi bacterium]|nr:hypothetical protein [Chloroflexota bacterium]